MNVIDGRTGQIVDTFLIDSMIFALHQPLFIVVNSNTNKVYVGDSAQDNVKIIDGSNNEIIETFTVGKTPVDMGINISNNLIYVSNQISGNITVIRE